MDSPAPREMGGAESFLPRRPGRMPPFPALRLDSAPRQWQIAAMRAPLILTAFALASPMLIAGPAGEAAGGRAGPVAIPGLHAPVRLVTDRFGIPHIGAHSLSDLYLAWGYVTARDRLWQLEYSRRAGRGQMWRRFGDATL